MPLAAESNCGGASKIGDTKLLEHALVKLDLAIDASPVTVREDWCSGWRLPMRGHNSDFSSTWACR